MSEQAMWIVGILVTILIMVIGFMVGLAFSRIKGNSKDIADINKELGDFVSIESCERRKESFDLKITDIYRHQERNLELLRKDIKDLGKTIQDNINRHADDHLKAYHKE